MSQRKWSSSCLLFLLATQLVNCKVVTKTSLLGYQESCPAGDNGVECDSEIGLKCRNKKCRCDAYSVYDKGMQRCTLTLYSQCYTPKQLEKYGVLPSMYVCPSNSSCISEFSISARTYPPAVLKHVLYRDYADKYSCRCNSGFASDTDMQECKPTLHFGDTCSEELKKSGLVCDANDGFACGDAGKCVCENPKTMDYNTESKLCVVRLGENCTYNTVCQSNAICSSMLTHLRTHIEYTNYYSPSNLVRRRYSNNMDPYESTKVSIPTCACISGYVKNSKGKCVANYGVSCSVKSPCSVEGFLACIDGICQCEKGTTQVFSESKGKKCHVLPGSSCLDNGPSCAPNSICTKGRCQCNSNYSEGVSGTCLLNHDVSCTAPSDEMHIEATPQTLVVPCNNFRGLSCIESKCRCFDSSLHWNPQTHTCTAGEGSRCGEVSMLQAGNDVDLYKDPLYPRLAPAYKGDSATSEYETTRNSAYLVTCAEGLVCDYPDMEGLPRCKIEKK